ncbi:electron transfer flavoprotein subunit beta/FixA family protein [Nocardioides jensenii]|uniref:electron transfer flavoprotein subunit beta/FixA family protein n=1 Tax=Nocardioides jensenii TaxID=1843 RepID=UPI00082BC3B6|nr:electron transfer flavoprotein subunit alpha [Nocardioides jensenii]
MVDVLVCVKRVPDSSGEVLLTADAQAVDARYVGSTLSDHDNCAVELATQLVETHGGTVSLVSVGAPESVEQLRSALSVGPTAATLVETDLRDFGPADIAHEIAEVVRAHAELGREHDLVLLGNDAADTGDFQVPVRLAHALGRPVVTGIKTVAIENGRALAHGDSPDGGRETFDLPLPAVVAVSEGGVSPRYPTIKGRMGAKKVEIEMRTPTREPHGSGRVRLTLPPPAPSTVQVLGEGPEAAPAVVDLFQSLGVLR